MENFNFEPCTKERRRRLFAYLQSGKRSAIDICATLHIADPRSDIRNLRKAGVNVCDEWAQSATSKYKRYWIEPSETMPKL